jgi:tetratricopeptide (TPR) repeat protein
VINESRLVLEMMRSWNRRPVSGFSVVHFLLAASPLILCPRAAHSQPDPDHLLQRRWTESRTTHFRAFSCGQTQPVARITARLEQFREAYSLLAGQQAVASPPIIVIAFPDYETLRPFLPLHDGRPANLTAFFHPGSDENLIVLPLIGHVSLEAIFHEYTHLLLRHNGRFWPIWLEEGMAEIYSTFEVVGSHTARIGHPIERHLAILADEPLTPLARLFSVTHSSPEYNERQHQGVFYAQSWLLTHYLMLGGNPTRKAQFGQLTTLLRQGQLPEQAFTNAFHCSLATMQNELRNYLARGTFKPMDLSVAADLSAPQPMVTRGLGPAEVCFRLGDELLRIGRAEDAKAYFLHARTLAPKSPLSYEGLGLLAAEQDKLEEAVETLRDALRLGSTSFLAHYVYAACKYQLLANAPGGLASVPPETADEIRSELGKSLQLMPDFGPAHHLLGILELTQGQNAQAAEKHLKRAIQLEPERESYLYSLAQAQLLREDAGAARQTLEQLRRPYVDAAIRAKAEDQLRELNGR